MKQSGYQTRINKKLAELSIAINPTTLAKFGLARRTGEYAFESGIAADQEWNIVQLKRGHRDCELCNHRGIKNIFVIECGKNKERLEIGSECAKNYEDADLVDGLCRIYNVEYKKIVNPIKYEKELVALEWAIGADVNFDSLSRIRYNLVNYGSARSLIQKIKLGKNIGKREKEVIHFWNHIYNNQDLVKAFDEWYVADAAARAERRIKIRQERIAILALGRLFKGLDKLDPEYYQAAAKIAEEGNQEDNNRAKNIIYHLLNGWGITDESKEWIDSWKPTVDENEVLFSELLELELNDWEAKFVRSCHAFYHKYNRLSEKQLRVLNRIHG